MVNHLTACVFVCAAAGLGVDRPTESQRGAQGAGRWRPRPRRQRPPQAPDHPAAALHHELSEVLEISSTEEDIYSLGVVINH